MARNAVPAGAEGPRRPFVAARCTIRAALVEGQAGMHPCCPRIGHHRANTEARDGCRMTEVTEAAMRAALDVISKDVARGVVRWDIRPYCAGRIVLTLTSEVRPTTWLAMHTNRAGWEAIAAAGFSELDKADELIDRGLEKDD